MKLVDDAGTISTQMLASRKKRDNEDPHLLPMKVKRPRQEFILGEIFSGAKHMVAQIRERMEAGEQLNAAEVRNFINFSELMLKAMKVEAELDKVYNVAEMEDEAIIAWLKESGMPEKQAKILLAQGSL